MKKSIFTLAFLGFLFISLSFKHKKAHIPPGTMAIGENLFADKTEISNLDWKEYLNWLKGNFGQSSDEYQKALPNKEAWADQDEMDLYLNHPEYDLYPAVGISYEQALAYCQWRSKVVNEIIWISNNSQKHQAGELPESFPKVFEYRLPTKEEWNNLLQFQAKKTCINEGALDQNHAIVHPKKNYIVDLGGNVSEMIAEKGLAMGGNWKIGKSINEVSYQNPSSVIGFRCIAERQ